MGVGLFHFAAPMQAEKDSDPLYASTMSTRIRFIHTSLRQILRSLQRLCDVFSLYRAQEEMPSLIVVNCRTTKGTTAKDSCPLCSMNYYS